MSRLPMDRRTVRVTAGLVWDSLMVVLALFSVALVLWYETRDLSPLARERILQVDLALVVLFFLDWCWWLYRSKDRTAYLKRTWWDLLGMVPLVVAGAGLLRMLRLLRLLRIVRAMRNLGRLLRSTEQFAKESSLIQLGVASSSITLVGALLIWFVEAPVEDAQIRSFAEAMWWAIVTVTTVGYGDVTPVTTIGRAIAVVLMVTGIGTIGLLASEVSTYVIRRQQGGAEEDVAGTTDAGSPESLVGQLSQLARLHDEGRLTDDEYQAAKAKVLE